MYYKLVNQNHPQAMRLQSIGVVMGTPAKEVKVGSMLMWNFGCKSEVIEILNETEKTITVKEKSIGSDYVGSRKFLKTRLVCLLTNN